MNSINIDITKLKTVKNFAKANGDLSTTHIYNLIKDKRLAGVEIDGIKFVDTSKTPSIPNK